MADLVTEDHKQGMISSFLADTAHQFLQVTGWKLDEAILLFYVDNEGYTLERQSDRPDTVDGSSVHHANDSASVVNGQPANMGQSHIDDVRPPLPIKRDELFDDPLFYASSGMSNPQTSVIAFRNFDNEIKCAAALESEGGSPSTAENPHDNLASLYRPPFHLMFPGLFEKVSDDTIEGGKVRTFYKLDSFPEVLVIDPITGQKMQSRCGMIQPESLLEDLMPFMEDGPKSHHVTLSHKRPREKYHIPQKSRDNSAATAKIVDEDAELQAALSASMEYIKSPTVATEVYVAVADKEEEETCSTKETSYPPHLEEPKGDRSLLCRVGVHLPDGRRVQRNFLRTDPIQMLWSFSHSHLGDAEKRPSA